MITIPTLAGVPPVLATSTSDPTAARCALAIAPPGDMRPIDRRGALLEHAALQAELLEWTKTATKDLEIFRPHCRLWLGFAPSCECDIKHETSFSIWLSNANGDTWDSRWIIEPRFARLERAAPGLVAAALRAIAETHWHALPVFSPYIAIGMASFTWWYGEMDETYALSEYYDMRVDEPVDPSKCPIPRRAWFDKMLPPVLTQFKGAAKLKTLERYARFGGTVGELATRVLELREAGRKASRAKPKYTLHGRNDELHCAGFGATLRWNTRDPMPQVYDDHWHNISESEGVEDPYGWFPFHTPKDLPDVLAVVAAHFALARRIEHVIELIAERSRS